MPEFLEIKINEFTYRFATDRYYNDEGVWAKEVGDRVRVGISDSLRLEALQRRGLEIKPDGSQVQFGDELVVIETVKALISLSSPVTGRVLQVNPASPAITRDPYGAGWLAELEATNWEYDRARLLDAQAFSNRIKETAKKKTHKT